MNIKKVLDALDPVFQRTLGATFPAAGVVVPRAPMVEHVQATQAAAPAKAPLTSALRTATGTLRVA